MIDNTCNYYHHHNHFLFVNHHHSASISIIIILSIIQSTWSSPWPFFQLSSTIMVANNRPNVWICGNSPWYILIPHVVEVLTNSLNMHASKTEWSNKIWINNWTAQQPSLIDIVESEVVLSTTLSVTRIDWLHQQWQLWYNLKVANSPTTSLKPTLTFGFLEGWMDISHISCFANFIKVETAGEKQKTCSVWSIFCLRKKSSATITLTFGWSVMTVPTCNVCKMIWYRVVRARTPATKHIASIASISKTIWAAAIDTSLYSGKKERAWERPYAH